jgi:tetratricopeptide (TPR) repeat protein
MSFFIARRRVLAAVIGTMLAPALPFARAQTPPNPPASQTAPPAPGANADAKAYVEYGAASGQRGDLDAAISAFQKAIKIDPKFAPAYYNLGYAELLEGKKTEALKSFDQTIQIDPNFLDAYTQRGNMRGQSGDFAGAVTDFKEIVRLSPDLATAHYNLGHVYYFTGDLDNASKELDTALSLDPKQPFAYFIRGLIRRAQGRNSEATGDFRKSLGFNFPDAAFWIFISESEDGLSDAAQKDLSDALATPQAFKPDDFPSAVGTFLLGHLPEDQLIAKAQAAKENERNDFTCAAWFYAGMADRLAGNKADARDCFTKAIATNSKGSEEYVEAQREIAKIPGL